MSTTLSGLDGSAIIHGLPIEQYHRGPMSSTYVSKSGLDDLDRSPRHFKRMREPDAPPREETQAQLVGNLFHCALLEPAAYASRYPVGPAGITRAHKDWKAFEASLSPSQTAIKPEDDLRARLMVSGALEVPEISQLLSVGEAEISVYWTDKRTGIPCRCRPDWVHPVGDRGDILVDAKSVGDSRPNEFARQVRSMRYHVQDAFYSDGWEAATGRKVLGFVFLASEVGFPHTAAAYMLDEADLEDGRAKYRRNLDTLAECRASGVWPGPAKEIATLPQLPNWAKEPQE